MIAIKFNFIDILVETANDLIKVNEKYIHRRFFSNRDYFEEIIEFLRNETYWMRHKGKIKGKTLNKRHNLYVKYNVYKIAYTKLLNLYFDLCKFIKLKYQSTDSQFVKNKLNMEAGRNKLYKNKKGIKIAVIIDEKGIPFSLDCFPGNMHDSKTINELLEHKLIETHTNKYIHSNKYKQYFLADKAYDVLEIKNKLIQNGYEHIIDFNVRNTKDPIKLKAKKLNKKQKKIYTKRIKVENSFSWLSQYPKMNIVVEKTIESFKGLVYLAYGIILSNRLNRIK